MHVLGCQCEDCRLSERDRVNGWRLYVLVQAGFPIDSAERLASLPHVDVDLHRALDLVAAGCSFEDAEKILT